MWSLIAFLVRAMFWLVRTAVTLTLIIVPLLGLLGLVLALVYRPNELAAVVRSLVAQEEEPGLEDADTSEPVVA